MPEWTPKETADLRKYWTEGKLSCTQIAVKLSERHHRRFTKMSVIGRANRLGLPRKRVYTPEQSSDRPMILKPRTLDVFHAEDRQGHGIPWASRWVNQCAFFVSRSFVCGQPTRGGSPYCQECSKKVYTKKTWGKHEIDRYQRIAG